MAATARDTEQLVVSLEARIKDFERNFRKANKAANENWTRIEARGRQAGKRIEADMASASAGIVASVRSMGSKLLGVFGVGGIGAAGILAGIREAASGLAEVRAEAKRAGLASEEFQELGYAARQTRIDVDALTDGMKELQLRADEFITTGSGPGAQAFQRIGLTPAELKTRLQDPADLLEEIIRRVERLDRAAQLRTFDEIFGGQGGEQFVRFIERGADGVARLRQEARDTGNVLSDDVLKRAEDIDREFSKITHTVGTNLKGAIVGVVGALADFWNALHSSGPAKSLSGALAGIDKQIEGIHQRIAEAERISNTAMLADLRRVLEELEARRLEISRALAVMGRQAAPGQPAATPSSPAPVGPAPTFPRPPTKPDSIAHGYQQLRDAAERYVAALQAEMDTMGMATAQAAAYRFEQDLLAEAEKNNVPITDARRVEIAALARQYGALTAGIEQAKTAQDELDARAAAVKGIASNAFGGFAADLRHGVDAATALSSALGRVADRLVDMAVQGLLERALGPLLTGATGGGIFGGLLAGFGLAGGGYVRGPGTGTSDSIPARLSNGEYVVNADATRRHRALLEAINGNRIPAFARGGPVGPGPRAAGAATINIAPTINVAVEGGSRGPTADQAFAQQIGREVEAHVRRTVVDVIQQQLRPGNILNPIGSIS